MRHRLLFFKKTAIVISAIVFCSLPQAVSASSGITTMAATTKEALCQGATSNAECSTNQPGLMQTIGTITNILLYILGAIAVLMIIVGGIRYVVSAGDQSAVTSAKNTIMYAVIGLILAFTAYAIVNFVIMNVAPPQPQGATHNKTV